jgi:hypothetical protein
MLPIQMQQSMFLRQTQRIRGDEDQIRRPT